MRGVADAVKEELDSDVRLPDVADSLFHLSALSMCWLTSFASKPPARATVSKLSGHRSGTWQHWQEASLTPSGSKTAIVIQRFWGHFPKFLFHSDSVRQSPQFQAGGHVMADWYKTLLSVLIRLKYCMKKMIKYVSFRNLNLSKFWQQLHNLWPLSVCYNKIQHQQKHKQKQNQ